MEVSLIHDLLTLFFPGVFGFVLMFSSGMLSGVAKPLCSRSLKKVKGSMALLCDDSSREIWSKFSCEKHNQVPVHSGTLLMDCLLALDAIYGQTRASRRFQGSEIGMVRRAAKSLLGCNWQKFPKRGGDNRCFRSELSKEGDREMRERDPEEENRVGGRNREVPANLFRREKRHTHEEETPDQDRERPLAGLGLGNREKGAEYGPTKKTLAMKEDLKKQQLQSDGWPDPTGNEPDQTDKAAGRSNDSCVTRWSGGGVVAPPEALVREPEVMELDDERVKCACSGVEYFP